MKCPRCAGVLNTIIYEGVAVDVCQGCDGVWLDGGEISLINQAREVEFSKEEREAVKKLRAQVQPGFRPSQKPIICPRCDAALDALNYAYSTGIMIDHCSKCDGLWLDKGELEQIQIVVEEYEQKTPELKKKFKPVLSKIKRDYEKNKKNEINEAMADRPQWRRMPTIEPLLKSILYRIL